MARLLNAGVLPVGYYAVPFLDHDGPVEIDVAALHEPGPTEAGSEQNSGLWGPPAPGLMVAVEWQAAEEVRVEVLTDTGDPRLAAVVELVSPRNKDRPRAREAFAAKCADNLQRGCGLVVVDVVTTRGADLHLDLMAVLGVDHDTPEGERVLSAVAYRSMGGESDGQLQAWPTVLEIGHSLPTLPLWLGGERAVPLDLDASHAAACVDLRIRQAG
jgi:hypothetical protein